IPVGDPNGIGPEIALAAALEGDVASCIQPVLVGDQAVIQAVAAHLGQSAQFDEAILCGALALHDAVRLKGGRQPGTISAAAGEAAVLYARLGIGLALDGTVDAVVAAPHNETAIAQAGISFDGYPRLLAETTETDPDSVFLMLVSPRFRVVHVTLHVALRRALEMLTVDRVLAALRATDAALQRIGVPRPSLAVCGINPHAGESGLFGDDDDRITAPAVERACAEGIDAHGPAGADLLLMEGKYDAYLAMYHDQGHIPVKLEGRDAALGLSIGTPVLFSTVAHGSAHDIAGTGKADPSALIGALLKMSAMLRNAEQPTGRAPLNANGI
ncbi:MAG: 4-hydroxythreonine-4-phosphate dehydrogenase PdxA, partial [Caldilineaceae bacterium]|nr:4-hydroxythreonine-4-phosphate dehydrogenase PdxA [Caldilineaceae bacterium]